MLSGAKSVTNHFRARPAQARSERRGGTEAVPRRLEVTAMRPAVAPAMGATCATSTSYGGRRSGAFANHPSRVRRPTRTGRRLRTAHRASPRDDVLEVTPPIPWADRCNLDDGAHPTTQRGDETLEDAARFVDWRVVDVNTGEDIGTVREALGMASGEVVASLGHTDDDEIDADDEGWTVEVDPFSDGGDDYYDDEDEDDEDEGEGFEVIYEDEDAQASASYEDDDEYDGDEDAEYDEYDAQLSSSSFDTDDDRGPPPMSLVLRVRGHRLVAGAGGVVNKEPITHLIPLARSIFPRWNHEDKVLAADPPAGLLDLGARQSKIRGLRRDLQPYCSRISDAEQGMPKKTALSRAGREDLIERIDELGGWYEAAAQLGLASKRKPNGYWENLDFLRDELLQLIYAFWFQEEDEETGETVWYNDISGALTYDTPAVDSGGGLDVPVMPSISDIQEAKRYDLQHAIIFHGGFIEVAEQLGWQMKRYGENRHLLAFSTFADEMHDFIEEMGEDIVPHGRLPTVRMMLDEDREDLVNAARWHGGMWEVGRRMRMKPFAASTLSGLPEAARALREFALESHSSHLNSGGDPEESVLMPSHEFIVAAGRHDLGWAYHLHGRRKLAAAAGLTLRTERFTYDECAEYVRTQVGIRNSVAFREWRDSGMKPRMVPADPPRYYGETGEWIGWAHFLGVDVTPGDPTVRIRRVPFLTYTEAKRSIAAIVASGDVALTTSCEYQRWNGRPSRLPRFPVEVSSFLFACVWAM